MIVKYALGYELFAAARGLLWFAPVVETATGHDRPATAINLSTGILIAHGWFYVVYLFACFRVWSLMRWGFVRFMCSRSAASCRSCRSSWRRASPARSGLPRPARGREASALIPATEGSR
jgi:hypothetical protein